MKNPAKKLELTDDTVAICMTIGVVGQGLALTLLFIGLGLIAGLASNASVVPVPPDLESGMEARIMFWGFATFFMALLLFLQILLGWFRIAKDFKQLRAAFPEPPTEND